LFQETNDDIGMMNTCNLLGIVKRRQGRLAEARAWYERSHEIATRLHDLEAQGIAAQNISIVFHNEGEVARQQGHEPEARQLFQKAKQYVNENVRISQHLGTQPRLALALVQLAKIQLLLGELDDAERNAHSARQICERLSLKEVYICYNDLALIANRRGDAVQAAEWESKRDRVLEELRRRAGGPEDSQ
jgi:tetratricopeptide (TPR) repeat protein